MGKRHLIAETGAGQHGVATATVGAKFGFPVDVYMGAVDVERQALNVYIMHCSARPCIPSPAARKRSRMRPTKRFGSGRSGSKTRFYVIGSVVGAHPYPYMVREFQKVIGDRSAPTVPGTLRAPAQRRRRVRRRRQQCDGHLRGLRRRCGRPAVGRRGRRRRRREPRTAASLGAGSVGVLHGSRSYLLQTADGQVQRYALDQRRSRLSRRRARARVLERQRPGARRTQRDRRAKRSTRFTSFARSEGIFPALESAHAIAFARKLARSAVPTI